MQIITDPVKVSPALEKFPADSSVALVFTDDAQLSVPELSLMREAARLCDRVVVSAAVPIQKPELLKNAAVDVLLQLPPSSLVEIEVRKQPMTPQLQAILLVLPNLVLIRPGQVALKAQLEALLEWSPGLTIVQEFKI